MAKEKQTEVADAQPSVSYLTALASMKLLKECSVMDLTEDDYDFLVQPKIWLPVDRSRARRCVEAAVYGGLDYVGFPRFPPPVEFVAAAISMFVHPQNIQIACLLMEGVQFTDNIINGVERPISPQELFAHVLRIRAGDIGRLDSRDFLVRQDIDLRPQ